MCIWLRFNVCDEIFIIVLFIFCLIIFENVCWSVSVFGVVFFILNVLLLIFILIVLISFVLWLCVCIILFIICDVVVFLFVFVILIKCNLCVGWL